MDTIGLVDGLPCYVELHSIDTSIYLGSLNDSPQFFEPPIFHFHLLVISTSHLRLHRTTNTQFMANTILPFLLLSEDQCDQLMTTTKIDDELTKHICTCLAQTILSQPLPRSDWMRLESTTTVESQEEPDSIYRQLCVALGITSQDPLWIHIVTDHGGISSAVLLREIGHFIAKIDAPRRRECLNKLASLRHRRIRTLEDETSHFLAMTIDPKYVLQNHQEQQRSVEKNGIWVDRANAHALATLQLVCPGRLEEWAELYNLITPRAFASPKSFAAYVYHHSRRLLPLNIDALMPNFGVSEYGRFPQLSAASLEGSLEPDSETPISTKSIQSTVSLVAKSLGPSPPQHTHSLGAVNKARTTQTARLASGDWQTRLRCRKTTKSTD